MTEIQAAEVIEQLGKLVQLCSTGVTICGLAFGGFCFAFVWRFFVHGPFQD